MSLRAERVGVLMGGWGGEREVSLGSGRNVLDALRSLGYAVRALELSVPDDLLPAVSGVEVVFNCLHGGVGEDGTLQALLDVLGIPYTGSGMLACALAMDKLRSKLLFAQSGLHVPAYAKGVAPAQTGFERWCDNTLKSIPLPVVVKPVGEGSSLGVHIVRDKGALARACKTVHHGYGPYLVEAFIPGKEVTAGVLCVSGSELALPLLELRSETAFYDYEAKYTPGMTEFVVPADLDEALSDQVRAAALAAHRALGCLGYSRVDFRVDAGGTPYVLEVNTSPGMTHTSDLPQVAAAVGMDFEALVEHMLHSAEKPRFQTDKDTTNP